MVVTMPWLTVASYLYHKWPGIYSVFRNHNLVLSSFMTYHRVCKKINTTSATSGAGTAYLSVPPEFTPGFQWDWYCSVLFFCVVFCRSLFVLVYFVGHCLVFLSSIDGFYSLYPFRIFKPLLEKDVHYLNNHIFRYL